LFISYGQPFFILSENVVRIGILTGKIECH
jgi:hypothetical protein